MKKHFIILLLVSVCSCARMEDHFPYVTEYLKIKLVDDSGVMFLPEELEGMKDSIYIDYHDNLGRRRDERFFFADTINPWISYVISKDYFPSTNTVFAYTIYYGDHYDFNLNLNIYGDEYPIRVIVSRKNERAKLNLSCTLNGDPINPPITIIVDR